ncbi:MAG: tetratricopeptide repeat protein [Candidatus Promineifilaceae bacterium]|jgi:tetratricopeptide (TPR) repeat protein
MVGKILARFYYMWGSLHRNFGNRSSFVREHRSAVQRFTQAYHADPNLRKARLDRGILYYREMGMLDEALEDFDALLEIDPDYSPALLNRAMVYQEQGRYADALVDLEAYLALPMEDEEYHQIASRTATLLQEIVDELESAGE